MEHADQRARCPIHFKAHRPVRRHGADPLNQLANREVLHNLAGALPGVDLTWFNHFLSTLFDHDNAKYAKDAAAGAALSTSMLLTIRAFTQTHIAQELLLPAEARPGWPHARRTVGGRHSPAGPRQCCPRCAPRVPCQQSRGQATQPL